MQTKTLDSGSSVHSILFGKHTLAVQTKWNVQTAIIIKEILLCIVKPFLDLMHCHINAWLPSFILITSYYTQPWVFVWNSVLSQAFLAYLAFKVKKKKNPKHLNAITSYAYSHNCIYFHIINKPMIVPPLIEITKNILKSSSNSQTSKNVQNICWRENNNNSIILLYITLYSVVVSSCICR